jgi:hypothetical protein
VGPEMELAFLWIAFSVVVGVAANDRGRNGAGWFFLALLVASRCLAARPCHAEPK